MYTIFSGILSTPRPEKLTILITADSVLLIDIL
jgi:hypothetical protein